MSAAVAFDRIAHKYDDLWTRSPVGRAQRENVWMHVDGLFRPGQLVLDVGCGTGEDALHLRRRGIEVVGIDASPRMVEHAVAKGVNARCLPVEQLSKLSGPFDGVLSNFGVFNCVAALDTAAAELARLVRPGGYFALTVMGCCCVWEFAYFAAHGQFRKAFRRLSRNPAWLFQMPLFYPSVPRLISAFTPEFRLVTWYGVGLLVPPSYVKGIPEDVVRSLSVVDSRIAAWPGLRCLCDHRLLILQRI